MAWRERLAVPWLPLLAGLALFTLLPLWQVQRAEQRVVDYTLAHVRLQGQGFQVWLYDNPFLTGPPRVSLHPAPRLHKDRSDQKYRDHPFSWRWLALLDAPRAGRYVLGVHAAQAVRLRLDGRPVIENWVGSPSRHELAALDLADGPHLLDLSDTQGTNELDLTLYWMPPGAEQAQVIPSQFLRPLDQATSAVDLDRLYFGAQRWRALAWMLPALWLILWWLALRDWPATRRALAGHWPLWLILALAAGLRLAWASTVPGVSGESAFFIWRAELILEGARPFQGMITRTGPLFDYLLTMPVWVFGSTALVLRASAALLNTLALVFCYRVLDREAGRRTAVVSCLLLATAPAVVMFSRNTVEYTALGPLLFFLGLDLLSLARRRPPLAIWAGVAWGLGIFNHSIFVVFPATLGLGALLVGRWALLRRPQVWGLGLGLGLAMLPRVVNRIVMPAQEPMSFFDPGRMRELAGFLEVFWRVLDGEVVFKLYTGQLLWDSPGLLAWLVLAGGALLAWGWWRRRDGSSWVEVVLGLALATYLAVAPLGAPSANPRYFAYAMILAMLLLGRAWARGLAWTRRPWRALVWTGLAGCLALNLATLGVNYFYCHLTTGGRPLVWGEPLLDHVSDAWMNHRPLARELARRGYPVVATGDFWHHTLHLALNLYQDDPPAFWAVDIASRSDTERAAVFYNSPEGRERMGFFLEGNPETIFLPVSLGPELDGKYLLLERTWPPVDYPQDLEGQW